MNCRTLPRVGFEVLPDAAVRPEREGEPIHHPGRDRCASGRPAAFSRHGNFWPVQRKICRSPRVPEGQPSIEKLIEAVFLFVFREASDRIVVPERIFSGSPPGGRRGGEIRRQVRQASLAAHFRGERLFADGFERGSSLEESLLSLPSAVG